MYLHLKHHIRSHLRQGEKGFMTKFRLLSSSLHQWVLLLIYIIAYQCIIGPPSVVKGKNYKHVLIIKID